MAHTIKRTSSNEVPSGYLTVAAAAHQAGVLPATIRRWARERQLPRTLRLSNYHLVINEDDLKARLNADHDFNTPLLNVLVAHAPKLTDDQRAELLAVLQAGDQA